MKNPTYRTVLAFGLGALSAVGVVVLAGAAGAPPNPALAQSARLAAIAQQLNAAEDQLADASAVQEFWERESIEQDSAVSRLSSYAPQDAVGPILFDRAKSLAFRAAVSLQDAKLRAHTAGKKVMNLKALLIAP